MHPNIFFRNVEQAVWYAIGFYDLVFLPALCATYFGQESSVYFINSVIGYFALFFFVLLSIRALPHFLQMLMGILAALQYILIGGLAIFLVIVNQKLELSFALNALSDVLPTIYYSLGKHIIWGGILVLLIFITISIYFITSRKYLLRLNITTKQFVLLWVLSAVISSQYTFGLSPYLQNTNYLFAASPVPSLFTSLPANISVESEDNIIILQLESVSSAVLAPNRSTYDVQKGMPYLSMVANDGIFFPFHWSNGTPTDRGQDSILCGIPPRPGQSYHYKPEELPVSCLPQFLKSSGYRTILAEDSFGPVFANQDNFVTAIGIDERYYADFMPPEEKMLSSWGYDNCSFYERLFEYLASMPQEFNKTFLYIAVAANHHPWVQSTKYSDVHKYKEPQNMHDLYVNSVYQQNFCVQQFVSALEQFNGRVNTHTFITADHGWDTSIISTINQQYLVPLIYLPPSNRAQDFAVNQIDLSMKHSHTDLMPTILEILTGIPYKNSFALELYNRKEPSENYEQCHYIVFNGGESRMAVVKGDSQFTYEIADEAVYYIELRDINFSGYDNPIVVEKGLSPDAFIDKYGCSRFQDVENIYVTSE